MRTEHHISKATLLDYAAGSLCEALSVVAASHLAWCRECRQAVEAAAKAPDAPRQAREGAMPADLGQTALMPQTTKVDTSEISDFGLPTPLALRLDGRSLEDISWRKVLPGVAIRNLALPRGTVGQLRLMRIAPGKALPEHGHGSCELSMVLRGAYNDGHGRYGIGDVADLDGAAVHRPVAEDVGCICLVAAETPVRYRSLLGRLWQRLTGI